MDNAALTLLESQLLTLQIQKAQERQPWELISTPTVLDNAVAPPKANSGARPSWGLVLGSGAALFIDGRTGLVYSEDELKSMLPRPLINTYLQTPRTHGLMHLTCLPQVR